MSSISIFLEESGTIPELLSQLDRILNTLPKALTFIVSDGNNFTKENFDPILTKLDILVSGAIFPKIIFKNRLLEKGTIIIAWYKNISITNYKNIEKIDSIKNLVGNTINTAHDFDNNGEYLLFIDGSVTTLEENLDALYSRNGFLSSFAGGGAGSLSTQPIPCIISSEGLLSNTMQTIATNHNSKTTVTHGWEKKSGPHLVTSVDRSKVKTLNYKSIIQFYKNHNNKFGKNALHNTSFSSYFKKYPLGIENIDGDLLIRDPIVHDENSIKYIGNIPEYSKIHILDGTKDSIREQVNNDLNQQKLKNEKNVDASFIFSSINRDDSDGKHHSKEVEILNQHLIGSRHVVGALSLGEIATSSSRLLQLHSKTIVVTRLRSV